MVHEYLPLTESLASQAAARYGFRISLDELRSAAALGLLEAIHRYEEGRGVPFSAFARHRINGAILDEVRGKDELSRPARRRARAVDEARHRLLGELKREPADEELAEACGEDLAEFRLRAARDLAHELESLEEQADSGLVLQSDDADPLEALCLLERHRATSAAFAKLPDRVRWVVTEYFEGGRPYRAIGEELGVSESRVCQIVRGALKQLRAELAELA